MKKSISILSIVLFLLILTGCSKKVTLELESNPSTGYEWDCEVSDINYAKIVDEEYEEDNDTDMVGVPGKQIFELKGLKEGVTNMTCKYQRSFEDSIEETKTYKLTTDKNLNITIEEITD